MAKQKKKTWLKSNLTNTLQCDIPDQMVNEILNFKTSSELENYLEPLLDKDKEEHQNFLESCILNLFADQPQNKKSGKQNQKKQKEVVAAQMGNKGSSASNKNSVWQNLQKQNQQPSQQQKQQQPKPNQQPQQLKQQIQQPPQQQQQQKQAPQQQPSSGKKTKYVSLYAKDGKVETVMLKGRRHCDCQASEHDLINNCLECGRIVCTQEGSGPCMFCGALVCTNEEMQVLKRNTKDAKELEKKFQELKPRQSDEPKEEVMAQRDRLLEFDVNSEKRTTVIDDDMDYFQDNSTWLTTAERQKVERMKEMLHEKKHASRAKRVVKVDFAGREIEDDSLVAEEMEQLALYEMSSMGKADSWSARKIAMGGDDLLPPNMIDIRPIYRPTGENESGGIALPRNGGMECRYNRVQDKELLEMQDMRSCLSMHQPWASLLIAGIKMHEGRVWYSEHRGRLWIAATAKEPNPHEIAEIENFYRVYYNDNNLKFPNYPIGCLLGCVRVEDCLAQEEYRDLYPSGESDSPYVFICSNPEKLPAVIPIQGFHKIYQIDPKIHMLACRALLRAKSQAKSKGD